MPLFALHLCLALCLQDGFPPARLLSTEGMDPEVVAHIEECVAAVEAAPTDGEAHAQLGLAYEANTCFEPAAESYRHAIALLPDKPEWRYRLGKVLVEIGDVEAAEKELAAASAKLKSTPVIQARLGAARLELGDIEGAEEAWQAAITAEAKQPGQPMFPESRVGLASVRYEQGRYQDAIDLCEKALTVRPGYRHAHYILAMSLFELGQDERAERELSLGMPAWPEFPPDPHGPLLASHARGYQNAMMGVENLLMAGRAQEALTRVETVLSKRPDDVLALILKARCLERLGRANEAIDLYRHCETLDGSRADTKVFLTIALLNRAATITDAEQRGALLQEALTKSREALAIAPRQGRAHFYYGFALLANGDGQNAFAEMNQALRLGCDEPALYAQLTQLAAKLGQMREMIQFAGRNAKAHPGDPGALQLLIQAYLTDNRFDEAEAVLARLESLNEPAMTQFIASVKQFISAKRVPAPPQSGPPIDDGKDKKEERP